MRWSYQLLSVTNVRALRRESLETRKKHVFEHGLRISRAERLLDCKRASEKHEGTWWIAAIKFARCFAPSGAISRRYAQCMSPGSSMRPRAPPGQLTSFLLCLKGDQSRLVR